jgi:hypothetical protein
MKQEPEWIDVVAMIAMHSILQLKTKNNTHEQVAYDAYKLAEAMIEEKTKLERSKYE